MISKGFVESSNKSCFDGYSPIQKRMKSDLNKNYSQMGMVSINGSERCRLGFVVFLVSTHFKRV